MSDSNPFKRMSVPSEIFVDEEAFRIIKGYGISMADFKLTDAGRKIIRESLGSFGYPILTTEEQTLAEISEYSMREEIAEEATRRMNEELMDEARSIAEEKLEEARMHQRVLPVTMQVNGEEIQVGDAVIDGRDSSFCVIHAVIDGESNVAALLKTDMTKISIGNREDFKRTS